jgi:hypothetical protein
MQQQTQSGFSRLSGDFNRGYTKAIQDIIEIVKYVQPDLKHHHTTLNAKKIEALLKCCLDNRGYLRDSIGNGFIRWNGVKNEFEYYIPKE